MSWLPLVQVSSLPDSEYLETDSAGRRLVMDRMEI